MLAVFPFLLSTAAPAALEEVTLSIAALGGSPLHLEVSLRDPHQRAESVIVESDRVRVERSVPPGDPDIGNNESDSEGDPTYTFTVSPFDEAGVHDLVVELRGPGEGKESLVDRREYRVGFADYVWGRDNFSFANDTRYRGDVESYSELLNPWLRDRFGPIAPDDRAVLLFFAYEVLRGQLGLCYAFSGAAVLYHRFPEQLPRFSDTVYSIREANRVVREKMSRLQNDIVFQRFVVDDVSAEPQSHRQVAAQLQIIRDGIDRGEPVVIGTLAPERHHSMAAYGYIENRRTGQVTVVAANNWDRNETDNYSNASVENIHVNPVASFPAPPLAWPLARHAPYREPTHLVAVELQEEYSHDPGVLNTLIGKYRQELISRGRRTVILEGIQSVRFTDVPDADEYEQPSITRINRNAIVDLPPEGRYELEITAIPDEQGGYELPQLVLIEVPGPRLRELRVVQHTLEMETPRRRITIR